MCRPICTGLVAPQVFWLMIKIWTHIHCILNYPGGLNIKRGCYSIRTICFHSLSEVAASTFAFVVFCWSFKIWAGRLQITSFTKPNCSAVGLVIRPIRPTQPYVLLRTDIWSMSSKGYHSNRKLVKHGSHVLAESWGIISVKSQCDLALMVSSLLRRDNTCESQ